MASRSPEVDAALFRLGLEAFARVEAVLAEVERLDDDRRDDREIARLAQQTWRALQTVANLASWLTGIDRNDLPAGPGDAWRRGLRRQLTSLLRETIEFAEAFGGRS